MIDKQKRDERRPGVLVLLSNGSLIHAPALGEEQVARVSDR
jgi:hypothetical protein